MQDCIRYVAEPSPTAGYFFRATAQDARPLIVHEAIPVEVDVKLALGEFSLDEAAKYLQEKVPMDAATAHQEATSFSTAPGQAITYQIGKLQITKLLAEARMKQGDKFDLRAFHNFIWKNGTVPIALQRWELLGSADDVPMK